MTQHPGPEVLSAYLDGETTAEEQRQVDVHLTVCAACRQHLAELRQTAALVQTLEPVAAPQGFRSGVRNRVQQGHSPLRFRWPLQWRPSWRVIATATAVLLVGLFSINLLQQLIPHQAVRESTQLERSLRGAAAPPQRADQAPATKSVAQAPSAGGFGREVIRSAELTIEVRSLDDGAKALMRTAESAGGFIANTTIVHEKPAYGTFELRVPAGQFGRVLDQVEQAGEVKARHVSGQDVTEDFMDLQARIRNLDRHEHQLLTFMDRATKVADLLAIEQELARVRGEIEQLTGRLRYITNRVELASLTVTLREKAPQKTGFWDFTATGDRIVTAFLNTVREILITSEHLAVAVSALLPLVLLAVPGWVLLRLVARRRLRLDQ